ncbi:MAG: uridine phosphorylase [bacterium]
METVYHLKLTKKMLEGARFALLPGDPQRVEKIAQYVDAKARLMAEHREFTSWLGYLDKAPVLTVSTGIGGPSTAIVVEELAKLGVDTFIRLGTSGAIQDYVHVRDIIITTASVRLDGTSRHYAPLAYPAVANYEVLHALVTAAGKLALPHHLGITASSDSFYPGQERYDTFSHYVIKRLQGTLKEWQKLGVLNYEMESAALFTVCNALGLRAGCITCAVINRGVEEEGRIQPDSILRGEEHLMKVGVEALRHLMSRS